LSRRPFEAFRVVLSGGDNFEVGHPETALMLRKGIYIAQPNAANELPEETVWFRLLHLAAIEPVATKPVPVRGNGSG
jgi:hypothetical protein